MFHAHFFETEEEWPFTSTLVDLGWDIGVTHILNRPLSVFPNHFLVYVVKLPSNMKKVGRR